MSISPVGTGIRDALRIATSYTARGGPGLPTQVWGNRHVILFSATQSLHPSRLHVALGSYRHALSREAALFRTQVVDDVTDAMRHVNSSALVVDRLTQHGERPSVAAEFMRRLGRAHERDSRQTGEHRLASRAMDLFNNDVGIEIGLAHSGSPLQAAARESALEGAVLQALASGRARVLDGPNFPLRPSTADDLARVLRDPSLIGR